MKRGSGTALVKFAKHFKKHYTKTFYARITIPSNYRKPSIYPNPPSRSLNRLILLLFPSSSSPGARRNSLSMMRALLVTILRARFESVSAFCSPLALDRLYFCAIVLSVVESTIDRDYVNCTCISRIRKSGGDIAFPCPTPLKIFRRRGFTRVCVRI